MIAKRRVLLYGKSLILGTVAASLRRQPHLELISLAPPFPAMHELMALQPDVILFDLDAARPEAALALLQARPHLLLIGIDASSDQMLLWSGQRSRALNMEDLVQAIGTPGGDSPAVPDGASARRVTRFSFREHLARLTSLWTGRVLTRRQKLAFALAAVALTSGLAVVLSQDRPGNAPLTGTAMGGVPVETWLAFMAGIFLGFLLLWLWPRLGRRRR